MHINPTATARPAMTVLPASDSQSCGCDAHPTKKNLLSIDAALRMIAVKTKSISDLEDVPLANASGRVLGASVRSRGMVPPFDNSAMDGYAIHTDWLAGDGPWQLEVTGRIAAGQNETAPVCKDTAVQIFTGAALPPGANAVVMQEDVQRKGNQIKIMRQIKPGCHVRFAGEDMKPGTTVVRSGRRLTARDIAACAAAGHANVQLCRPIRAALVVTGDEVRQTGTALGAAAIWDVNTPMISTAMSEQALTLTGVHPARDTRAALQQQIAALAKDNDLIVTTGGISVGAEDHVKQAIEGLGGAIAFSGVALKPGKPISFGHIGGATWLGLPGNPLSAFITWSVFGTAVCRALSGRTEPATGRRHVVLADALTHKPGRCELRLASLTGFDPMGREVASFASATHSGRVAQLPQMDGMLFVPADTETLPAGALVEFQPF